ncbi:hypothetical protein PPYR_03075 [Photinus pyralis]|uniref:Uncharacterized protein n=1 Tax=Photinus pyralis TaxID=7054 RepID=A0A5N4A1S4_PHOPY|nr:uncharacterized protein LOC116162511 [Photinus pyralis]KAB0791275.1 hypothetical protein PPYR_03075 [Photinus pyralis]
MCVLIKQKCFSDFRFFGINAKTLSQEIVFSPKTFEMLNVLVAVTFVSLAIGLGQTTDMCATLAPFYKTFGCVKPCLNAQRYSCYVSPIKKYYKMDKCYFQGDGKYYSNGATLPVKYHNGDSQLCSFRCYVGDQSSFGPVFLRVKDTCVATDKQAPLPCYSSTLNEMDYFYSDFLPVFAKGQPCPTKWIYSNFPSVTSDDCSADPYGCCTFNKGATTLKVGRNFTVAPNTLCKCNCPPFVECMEQLKLIAE